MARPDLPQGQLLYTQHCAACHGESGRGNGPAAIAMDVRPRDFRNEQFRYVSTLNGVPTERDLLQTIRLGRHFGAMPARPSLTDAEVRLLADYVREINRLGWVERLTEEFGDDEDMTPEDIDEIAHERVAPSEEIAVPPPGRGFRPDTGVGRDLYMQSCASCHGPWGRGDGLDLPRDDRGKPITVRDLTTGEFHGGTQGEEIFKRIRCGIPGTPMPAQEAMPAEDIWHLVHYVEFLAGRHRG